MTTPLPFTWPYSLVFWLVYFWVFIPEIGVIGRARRAPIPREDQGSLRVVLVTTSLAIAAAFVLAFAVPSAAIPTHRVAWFVAGVLTMIAGSLLRRHCFRVLGAFFTGAVMIQTGHRVVDVGAYRWVRHPSYTAGLLLLCGIALALGNWLSVVVVAILGLFAYTYRARIEEQALLASLGDEYGRFMAARKRFIPFIY
jgi:protein-S-isoprenylcysteine O-methyltransferase Ste14